MATTDPWVSEIEKKISGFAKKHSINYRKSEREVSASFEIGCFHALTEFYEKNFEVIPENLTSAKEYRYLTTPSGNPVNFSFIRLRKDNEEFELRQQVRIRSHLHADIAFTPDMVVIVAGADINAVRDADYAGGKRSFFCVDSNQVIAAHECKSMNPFPELLISYVGMLVAAHSWISCAHDMSKVSEDGVHLAPSLFIGGSSRALHTRMVRALEACYPINIILGLHAGTWSLLGSERKLNLITLHVE
jgi:hypothetical protein